MKSGAFQGASVNKLGPQDIRFTRNKANTVVYAIALGWPAEPSIVKALGTASGTAAKIANVEVLGVNGKVHWSQDAGTSRDATAEYTATYGLRGFDQSDARVDREEIDSPVPDPDWMT